MIELTIFKENDTWTAHVGPMFHETVFPLVPASESLLRLVTAIHNVYPESKVWIDSGITDNPFLNLTLRTMRQYRMTPFYEDVQRTIDNSAEKVCNLCESRACYNSRVNGWVCTNRKCSAQESFLMKGSFFKLSRNARKH